uniref:Protein-serine/threonine phosphatase n=1 Tax=Rhizochromulina marina TaxID=1034831 RepID=A0A7S2WMZ6_9STRA|mmetsp:Transcript_2935/g.8396  ORF Transcript_2935/g.8396 Transcript_2935/m.8396 type:complete len:191 (+) Transcript_2935:102-674(+)
MAAVLRQLAARRYSQIDNALSEVRPGIFVGSIGAVQNIQGRERAGITHVLSLLSRDSADNLGFLGATEVPSHHLLLSIDDKPGTDLVALLPEALDFVLRGQAVGGVLVHCFQGKSRSVAVVMAYLMITEGIDHLEALEQIRLVRPVAAPNLGFILQLRRWGRRGKEELTLARASPSLSGGGGGGGGERRK